MRSKKYLAWIRKQPCCSCGNPTSEPHHIIGLGVGLGMMGGKASDLHTMPLCRSCHDEVHRGGSSAMQIRWMFQTQEQAAEEGVISIR